MAVWPWPSHFPLPASVSTHPPPPEENVDVTSPPQPTRRFRRVPSTVPAAPLYRGHSPVAGLPLSTWVSLLPGDPHALSWTLTPWEVTAPPTPRRSQSPSQFHEHLGVTTERKRSCPGSRGCGAPRAGLQERDNPLAPAPRHLTRPRGREPGPGTGLGMAAERQTGPHKERVPWKWR